MQLMGILILFMLSILIEFSHCDPQIPCYFVFGDSLADNGNNNLLPTSTKANYAPYGIDYPGSKPTGRFGNGRNIADIIATHLGFEESPPPFASTSTKSGKEILKGVNYASGSSGILLETGQHLGARIPLDQQILNHQIITSRISLLLRNDSLSYLNKCLYTINSGSNDFLNNFYVPEYYDTSKVFFQSTFAEILTLRLSTQIKALYAMGARKVALFELGPIGCTPQAISKLGFLGILCANEVNVGAGIFNFWLHDLINLLHEDLNGANFTCINMAQIYLTSIPGFLEITRPCCKVRSDGLCQNDSVPCRNRNSHVFFDNFHPTDAFNYLTGSRAYRAATPFDAYPVDIRNLMQL